ncbi:hypothetical protein [Streptomyces sp. NBC_00069]|uniref:hypothetical protein n=1 Tax=Streptomyces sp. NBC_00069 TaxID=2975639 RepID=UPI00324BA934|nr:hypothetical protein OG513_02215 [Streptomyces sp. NBC_00998]
MNHWIHGPLAWIHGRLPHDEETNVVFFRGMSLDTLTRGLLGLHRRPLAYGKGADWGLMMHDMLSWDHGDYGDTDYGRVCPPGGELAVFITEPCSAKAHRPWFQYYRAGRLHTGFSFETLDSGVGEEPDLLLPALEAANLVGPLAQHGAEDFEERIVQAITGCLSLPELDQP